MPGVAAGVGSEQGRCAFATAARSRSSAAGSRFRTCSKPGPGHSVRCFDWARTPATTFAAPLGRRHGGSTPLLSVHGLRAEYRSRRNTVVAAQVTLRSGTVSRSRSWASPGSGKDDDRALHGGPATCPKRARSCSTASGLRHPHDRPLEAARRIQFVFQNPNASLNPDHTVKRAILRPLAMLRDLSRHEAETEVARLLELVRSVRAAPALSARDLGRRAPARCNRTRPCGRPDMIVCDEITSALDVSCRPRCSRCSPICAANSAWRCCSSRTISAS